MTIAKQETSCMKAIAIIFVLIPHIISNYFPETISGSTYYLSVMGIDAVFVFLFLSGYGLTISFEKSGIRDFWNKRVRGVFFPYWIVTILYFFLFVKAIGPEKLLLNLACVDYVRSIDGTMWYMSFYLLWMIAFYALFKMNVPTWFRIVVLFLIGWWFLEFNGDLFANCGWQFKRNAYSFPAGVLFGFLSVKVLRGKQLKQWWIKAILMAAAAAGFFLLFRQEADNGIRYMHMGLLAILFLHMAFGLLKIRRIVFVLDKIGKSSYILYLLEAKLLNIVSILFPKFTPIGKFSVFAGMCILTTVLTALIPVFMKKLKERWPDWLQAAKALAGKMRKNAV